MLLVDEGWDQKSVVITGGTGMLGLALARKLELQGASVTLLSRSDPVSVTNQPNWQYVDIASRQSLDNAFTGKSVDCVFHLAAQTQVGLAHSEPGNTFESNIRGVWLLLESVRTHCPGACVIVASTAATELMWQPCDEGERVPLEPYTASKMCAELLCRCYFDTWGLPLSIARLTNIYGPADSNFGRLIPGTISAVLEGRAPEIHSDGQSLSRFLFVDDAADALLSMAINISSDQVSGKVFNVGSEEAFSVEQVVRKIMELMGFDSSRLKINGTQNRPQLPLSSLPNKLGEQTGWRPKTPLKEGLLDTIRWYQESVL